MKHFIVIGLISIMFAFMARAQDDHANDPTLATLIPFGSTGVVGVMESDLDADWFRFVASPSIVYTIQVNNVSLWDNSFSVKAFADGDNVRLTNSAHVASPNRIVWTNQGGVRSYYIGVSAMFQFTTGTYSVAVSTNDYDLDGDGMADVWEMQQFGTLTNNAGGDYDSDGFVNGDEYKTGTSPANSGSKLAVTNLKMSASGSTVSWPGVAYGVYRVESSANLLINTQWLFKTRVVRNNAPGSEQYLDTAGTNFMRHYRVIYEY